MISERHRFLFVHVGKGAGNSISAALLPYSEDRKTIDPAYQDGMQRFDVSSAKYGTTKHERLVGYKHKLPPDVFGSLYKFAVIRNPYDRVVSAFFSPHRSVQGTSQPFSPQAFLEMIHGMPVLREFVCTSAGGALTDDIDCLLRFEHLADDFSHLCGHLGLRDVSLPWLNRSARKAYRDYYSDELRKIVSHKFAEEIDVGGYVF